MDKLKNLLSSGNKKSSQQALKAGSYSLAVTAVVLACLVGIGLVSLSVLGLCLSIIVIRLIWKAACWCGRKLYTAITKKPWAETPAQTPETGWQPQPEEPCVQPAAEEEVAE